MRVPVPYVGNDIFALRAELAWLVKPHLVIVRAVCRLVAPFYGCPADVGYQIAVGCSAAVHVACPPCSARGSDVVLVEPFGHLHVLVEMSVPAEHVHVASGKHLLQLFGICYVVLLLVGVPCRSVHVYQDERAVGHVAEVFLQPFHVGRHDSLLIFVASSVADVVYCHHMSLAYVERIVEWSELSAEVLFGIARRPGLHVCRSGIRLVEVVVADALENGHPVVEHGRGELAEKGHVVEYEVAQRHRHNLACSP